jgi:hypothetical protein
VVLAVAALLPVRLAGGAAASGATAPSPEKRAEARVSEARKAYERGDYQQSLGLLREAEALFASPKLHFNYGLVYRALGRDVEALDAFTRFLRDAQGVTPDRRTEAERQISELHRRVAWLDVAADADGADVLVDGRPYGKTPFTTAVAVSPGSHEVVVQKSGAAVPFTKRIDAQPGAEIHIRANISIPLVVGAPAPSTAPTVAATSGGAEPPHLRETARSGLGTGRTLALVLGGVGLAATGVGVAYGWIAMSRRNDAKSACPIQCPDANGVDSWNRARSAGNISTGAFVIGAIGLTGGVVAWLSATPVSVAVGTQVSLGPHGFHVLGRW